MSLQCIKLQFFDATRSEDRRYLGKKAKKENLAGISDILSNNCMLKMLFLSLPHRNALQFRLKSPKSDFSLETFKEIVF